MHAMTYYLQRGVHRLRRSPTWSGLLLFSWGAVGGHTWISTFILNEVGIEEGHNLPADRLILVEVLGVDNLEPNFEIRVANEKGWISLVILPALQEPAFVWIGVFDVATRVQAFDNVLGQTIIDLCAIIFAKDEPRLALRIPDDVLPISSGAGKEEGPF
jgi:hypothetical protein